MRLFHKKKQEEKTTRDILCEYIEKCLKNGNVIEEIVEKLKNNFTLEDIEEAVNFLDKKKQEEKQKKIDEDVNKKIKKYPRRDRSHLRRLYQDYKDGKILFPEGFNKTLLNKK